MNARSMPSCETDGTLRCRACGAVSPFKIVPICVACLDRTQATLDQIMEDQ
jgi:hypothetical protein